MIDLKTFFDEVRYAPFPGSLQGQQVQGMEILIKEFERRGMTDLRQLAYILATAYHETAHTMQPIKEMGSLEYLQSKKYWPWIGRGYVQLTWRENYSKFRDPVKKLFNADIMANPDDAMDPMIAAYITFEGMNNGTFTGKKLGDFFNDDSPANYWYNARTIVNRLDKATTIAGVARDFFVAITLSENRSERATTD